MQLLMHLSHATNQLKSCIQSRMEVFSSIISLENLNLGLEFILDHFMKIYEDLVNLKFIYHEKYPSESSVIINKGDKPSSSRNVLGPR